MKKETFIVLKNCGHTIGKDECEANPETNSKERPLMPTVINGAKGKKVEDNPDEIKSSGKERPLLPNTKF